MEDFGCTARLFVCIDVATEKLNATSRRNKISKLI